MSCGKKSASQDPKQADKKKLPKETVELKLPKLLDLGAHKCIPCKKMEPILAELTEEYKGVFEVEFIDVWQPENKAKAQQHKIQSIPTQIFFDETGTEIWRHVGFISKEDILAKWVELGYDFSLQSSGSCIQECDNEALAEAEPFGCCGK
ncbi:MAG: thioredoxin family protein [Candidatus Marinimicrobia bacterium]|nr:thioredoxin family protein [Candidatus Neomarinimicrobiota bacterium]